MALPTDPKRGSISASTLNTALGVASNTKITLDQASFRNLIGQASGWTCIADAYNRPITSLVKTTLIGTNPAGSAVIFDMTVSSGTIDRSSFYIFDYTDGVVGDILASLLDTTSLYVTLSGLSVGSRIMAVAYTWHSGGSFIASRDLILKAATKPGTPTGSYTRTTNSISLTVEPVQTPASGLPDSIYFTLYKSEVAFTQVAYEYVNTTSSYTKVFSGLPSNTRYTVYGSPTNGAGSSSISFNNVWTSSSTITSAPDALTGITLTGTSASRGVSWNASTGAKLYSIFIFEYVGAPAYFGVTYAYMVTDTPSISGVTGIPPGKNIYISLSAENWVGTTRASLNTSN